MESKRVGSQPSGKVPSECFIGTVRIDPLFLAPDPAFVQAANATFKPGARTAWHSRPLGQTLIVTAGCGWARREADPWRRSGLVMWSGSRPAKCTGTVLRRSPPRGDWAQQVSSEPYRQ